MAKSNPTKMVLDLSDSQLKILAEAARMGIPEMIVRLSAISAVGKVVYLVVNRLLARKDPAEVHFTQNVYGSEHLDPSEIYAQTAKLLKSEKVITGLENREGPVVEQEESAGGQELPKATFDIPTQAGPEDQG